MRTEAEMISLIKDVAYNEENIRAAYIEGSRTNPNVPKDIFQDYDIVYVVTATQPFREDKKWINRFGEILYMHYPEDNVFYPSDVENCYAWQIQFLLQKLNPFGILFLKCVIYFKAQQSNLAKERNLYTILNKRKIA